MITLTGEPLSTNNLYRSHCKFGYPKVYMTKKGKDLKESYQWEAKSQWKQEIISGEVEIAVKLHFKSKRTHDIDNYTKILLDALTGIIWEDDKQIQKMTISKQHSKENPSIEVEI